jgi:tRNA A-37 threonylcarbamoyl transferase component Bud32/uncharacterized RDD family membrane protein YckC
MTERQDEAESIRTSPEIVLKSAPDVGGGTDGGGAATTTTTTTTAESSGDKSKRFGDLFKMAALGLYDEDPSNMVRQARKMRPSAALISVAEIVDVGVIAMFGALAVSASVTVVACLLPGVNHDFFSIAGCALGSGIVGFLIFMFSALIPIFFPVALLVLQLASGSVAGAIALDAICAWFGADLSSAPLLASLSSIWLTLILSVLPILACPLYFALTLSSRWQTSIGWSIVGLMVCDENGLRPSFAKAWKRTILRLWWPIMFPGKLSYSGLIDDWVEDKSKTVLILKPQNLKAELIKAKDQLHKSTDKVTVVARSEVIGGATKQILGQRVQGASYSAQAIKRMLKPDWQAIVLRTESYFVVMLGMLFIARSTAAYWTQVYFSGFPIVARHSIDALVDQHPLVTQATPIVVALSYIALLILARRATPQTLQMTSKGFTLKSGSHKGKKGPHKWEEVDLIHLEQGAGKEQEEKWLVFSMRNQAPIKVRLDIIRSISSKEEILRAIERWAPHASKDPELINSLQPPSDYSYTDIWLEALTAPPKRDKLKPLIAGAVLKDNQYRVTDLIAVGGQGSVYLANDCVSTEDVVLKEFVLPVYVDLTIRRKAIERFEKEARLLKQLEHPQVVKLLDYFVEDHRAYMVLEHLNGKNLHQIVKQSGKLNQNEVTALALQMCEILKYLHAQAPPVVHRDFTPENLILGHDGTLRLIDFNVAQTLDQSATTTGTVVGKPSYLAPEQFQGEPTPLSDIYSFGATLTYLLTAEDPLPIAQSHPAQAVPTISAELDTIVATCTSYDSALRFQSIEAIEQALHSLEKELLQEHSP